jgi:glutamine cyclotransferase
MKLIDVQIPRKARIMKKARRRHIAARLIISVLAPFTVASSYALNDSPIPTYTYKVIQVYPHDPHAFTEGLFYLNGFLYESTGLQGHSSIRKVRLETGEVLLTHDLPRQYFGEGITYQGNRLIGLTWKSHIGFFYNLDTFAVEDQFKYEGEGWALTRNADEIIMSDGTSELRVLDPKTLRELHRIHVTALGKPVDQLNELEWVKGTILANIWQTDRLARIDPNTGNVIAWIDLTGLLPAPYRVPDHTDVLNGIAYDASADRLFVTGKLWPRLFEIQIVKKSIRVSRGAPAN